MCENKGFSYIIGLGTNSRLMSEARELLARAVKQFEESGEKQRLFCVFEYRAGSWDKSRTVIAKAEASRHGTNV